MFSLFKKKDHSAIKIIDRIWMTRDAKLNSFADDWKKNKDAVFICWFDETIRQFETRLAKETTEKANLITAREALSAHITGRIIFAEHYPLPQKETELFEKLHVQEVEIWSAMDEPLFTHFGGEKIVQLMKQFGMKEDQVIEHNMISKAIKNAQEKIEQKVLTEQLANSQKDWLEKNLAS